MAPMEYSLLPTLVILSSLHYTTIQTLLLSCYYTKYDIQCLIIFSVVTTLSCSTLILNSSIISVRHKYAATFSTTTSFLLLLLLKKFNIFIDTKFAHVTSTYYHSWYLVFEFTFNVNYFHTVSDIQCMRPYLVYQTLNIIFSVVILFLKVVPELPTP